MVTEHPEAVCTVDPFLPVFPRSALDAESREWLDTLGGDEPERSAAVARLDELLLRITRRELQRRSTRLRVVGPEIDDLAHHAAADALVAITAKLGHFRGESRFTTWAYKFVIFEVSSKIGRHFWHHNAATMNVEDWERLPDRFNLDPSSEGEAKELVAALRIAVDEVLAERQRRLFIAVVLNRIPLDALVVEFGSSRNAIYKMLFDARRKLRAALVANGYLDTESSRQQ